MRVAKRLAGPFPCAALLAFLALSGLAAGGDPLPSAPPQALQSILEETAGEVAAWRRPPEIPATVAFTVGVMVLAAAAFRLLRCAGCRALAAVFGIVLCLLALAAASAARRQFQARKLHAQNLIHQLRRQLAEYDTPQSATNQRQWKEELLARFREIWDLSAPPSAGLAPLELAVPVSADSDRPAWLSKSSDASGFYFAGAAASGSLESARKASLDAAMAEALLRIASDYSAGGRRRSDPLNPDQLRRYLRLSCVVEGVWFTYDRQMREFRYHTLIRLNRMLARPEVIRAFSG